MRRMIAAVLFLMPFLLMACGPYGHMRGWEDGGNYWWGFGHGYGGMFMGFILLIVLVVAIYFVVQALRAKNTVGQAQDTPLDILKKRYAKGEIAKEDFDRMKKDLE